jgi:hypothetical protein
MTPLEMLEKPRDVIHRHLLKLITSMHQEQVIIDLLGPNQNKRRRKKKKEKPAH